MSSENEVQEMLEMFETTLNFLTEIMARRLEEDQIKIGKAFALEMTDAFQSRQLPLTTFIFASFLMSYSNIKLLNLLQNLDEETKDATTH